MVLAAGRGKRMRPITATTPKPLVEVLGRSLIDRVFDRLTEASVETAVVNVHYLADLVEVHVGKRRDLSVIVSDERDQLLDTGGGVVKALPHLGSDPFYHLNSDSIWIEGVIGQPAIAGARLGRRAHGWPAAARADGRLDRVFGRRRLRNGRRRSPDSAA